MSMESMEKIERDARRAAWDNVSCAGVAEMQEHLEHESWEVSRDQLADLLGRAPTPVECAHWLQVFYEELPKALAHWEINKWE